MIILLCGDDSLQPDDLSLIHISTQQDKRVHAENCRREKRAMDVCQQKIADLGLEMQLVSAEYAFDGSKVLFFFTADGRVDFREPVSYTHLDVYKRQV